jgi:uncharacterized protein (DUF302 family)
MTEVATDYGFHIQLQDNYDVALTRVTAALKEEGFGVLTEIDVQSTLKKKIDVDFRRYKILGACNPPLAHRALTADHNIGLLLPCNVIVYENDGGGSTVSIVDPLAMLAMGGENDALAAVADDARARLQRVASSLT